MTVETEQFVFSPMAMDVATQFEALSQRIVEYRGIFTDLGPQERVWTLVDEQSVEVTPRSLFALMFARRERYRLMSQLGGRELAEALADKYLKPGEVIDPKRK